MLVVSGHCRYALCVMECYETPFRNVQDPNALVYGVFYIIFLLSHPVRTKSLLLCCYRINDRKR
jgi:hypothetical protein